MPQGEGYGKEKPKQINNPLFREHLANTGPVVKIGYAVGKNPDVRKNPVQTKPASKS